MQKKPVGRYGRGEWFPAACSAGGGFKGCYPVEGVADSLDEAQGETSPIKMILGQKLTQAISG